MTEIRARLNSNAVVFLVGEGGYGKTEMLTAYARSAAESARKNETFGGFPVLEQALVLRDDWPERAIARWASRPTTSLDRLGDRLRAPNRSAGTVLIVCVDGLDEAAGREQMIGRICEMCRESDGVRVVVTCREKAMENLVIRILGGGASGSGNSEARHGTVRVGEFQEWDLKAAITRAFGKSLEDLLDDGAVASLSLRGPTADPTTRSRLASISHPRMFGAFAELRGDIGAARDFLRGDDAATRRVAAIFLRKFFRKFKHRHVHVDGNVFDPKAHAMVYRDIARETLQNERFDLEKWCGIFEARRRPEQVNCERLRVEAASGGLIVERDGEWYWRHEFVAAFLASDDTFVYVKESQN
jgi:hypothetical protein